MAWCRNRSRIAPAVGTFAPVFQGPVAGHDGGTVFVAAHHHFQQVLAGLFGQGFLAHVINDHQVGLEIAAQGLVLLLEGFVFHEIAHQIEDGTVEDLLALFDRPIPQRLGQVGSSNGSSRP